MPQRRNPSGFRLSNPILLLLCLSLTSFTFTGCSNAPSQPAPPPTATPAVPTSQPVLVMYGPPGTKMILSSLTLAMEAAGLPYEITIYDGKYEGLSQEIGIQGLLDGTIDLVVMHGRPAENDQIVYREYLETSVILSVHPSAGITTLTTAQIIGIFSGEITNWSQVGGNEQDISVFVLSEEDTTTKNLREKLLGDTTFSTAAQVLLRDADMQPVINGLPGAIGYAARSGQRYYEEINDVGQIEPINIDGINPDASDYPLVLPIGIVYLREKQALLQPFLDWGDHFVKLDVLRPWLEMLEINISRER